MHIVDMHAHPLLDRLYIAPNPVKRDGASPRSGGDRLSIDALARGQVAVVVSSIYPSWSLKRRSAYMDRCHDIVRLIEAHLARHHDRTAVVTHYDEIEQALAKGKIAFIHAVEGGHVLEGCVENLERLYRWGVRSLTLTHFLNNGIAASSLDPRRKLTPWDGLTPPGREVIAVMNSLGMVIDLAHCSERAFWQAMEMTKHPVVVSHAGVRHFVPMEICLSDEQLRSLAQNGGVIGINLSPVLLKRFKLVADIDDLVDNILYVCGLVGVDHVGIASDFHGTPPIRGVATATDLPRIWARLLGAGLPDHDIAKIMGENFLRVFRQVAQA